MRRKTLMCMMLLASALVGCSPRSTVRKEPLPQEALGPAHQLDVPDDVQTVLKPAASEPSPHVVPGETPLPPVAIADRNVRPAGHVESSPSPEITTLGFEPTSGPTAKPNSLASRTRQLAARIQSQSPARLPDFMSDVRTGAANGNWEQVLESWDLQLELSPPSVTPVSNRNSLSSALVATSSRPRDFVPPEAAPQLASAEPRSAAEPVSAPLPEKPADTSTTETKRLAYRPKQLAPAEEEPVATSESTGGAPDMLAFADGLSAMSGKEPHRSMQWSVYSRLAYAMAGLSDKSLAPMEGVDPADQRFWRGYIYALSRYFDKELPRPEQRAMATAQALRDSLSALAEKADLEISEPLFCRAVHSFGNLQEFEKPEFKPGDGVVVYWEARNFSSEESPQGFVTRMKADFAILDSLGHRIHQFERKFKDDTCRTHRLDYFNVVVFQWPKDLTAGEYTLQVTVTDLTSNKTCERQRKLRIVP